MVVVRRLPLVGVVLFAVVVAVGCAPAIESVGPASVAAGETITITGANLASTATARLEADTGGSVQLIVVSGSAADVVARVPLAAPAGVYDVVIDVGGSEARLDGALTVVAGTLRMRFLDIGQGDATLITGPDGQSLLIDGGPRGSFGAIAEAVDSVGGVDHVAITHTDADHLAGVVEYLRGDDGLAGTGDDRVPDTRWIGHDDGSCDSQLCGELRALNADFALPAVGEVLRFGDATIEVLGRNADFGDGALGGATDSNEQSLAVVVRYAGRSIFVGGDLTGGGLGSADVEAIAADVVGPVDVLRVNHHGSATSTSPGFLDALSPSVAIISAGTDNVYCHPEASVIERLAAAGPTLFSTGSGITETDGRCTSTTTWPQGAFVGVGTIELVVTADGALSVDGVSF